MDVEYSASDLSEKAKDVMVNMGVVDYIKTRCDHKIANLYLHGSSENVGFFNRTLSEKAGLEIKISPGLAEFIDRGIEGSDWNLNVDLLVKNYACGSLNKSEK